MSLAATIVVIGIVAALRSEVSQLTDIVVYAVLVGFVGLVNVAVGAVALTRDRRSAPADAV